MVLDGGFVGFWIAWNVSGEYLVDRFSLLLLSCSYRAIILLIVFVVCGHYCLLKHCCCRSFIILKTFLIKI